MDTVILDACCTLNLAATGRIEEILRRLPYQFCIGRRSRGEALWLKIPDTEEREPVNLQPLIDQALLSEEWLKTSEEEALFVAFGASLADGEAEAAALAVRRGYLLATDDRKARRTVTERHPTARLTSTLELLKEWQALARPLDAELRHALLRISERATYRPRQSDPLWTWWAALIDE
jgi:hypothetical protein